MFAKKEITARCLLKVAGLAGSFYLIVYWMYFFYLPDHLNRMDASLPILVMLLCAAISSCLWCSISGGSLLYLSHSGLQAKKHLMPLVSIHAFFLLLIAGTTVMFQWQRFMSGAVFAEIGIQPAQIGDIIEATFTVTKTCLIFMLALSLWASICFTVFYFSLSIHCLLFLSMIFLTKALLSNLSLNFETLSYFAARNFVLYIVALILFMGTFSFRLLYKKMWCFF